MKTLKILTSERKNHFTFSYRVDEVSEYFIDHCLKLPHGYAFNDLSFKCATDHTIQEIWVFRGFYTEYDLNEDTAKNDKTFETWKCVYDYQVSDIDADFINTLVRKHISPEVINWYLEGYKKYKTLTLNEKDYNKHFSAMHYADFVSSYFGIPENVFHNCAFNFTPNKTVLEAWVFSGDYGSPEYRDENGDVTWTCLYNHVDSDVDHEAFSHYVNTYNNTCGNANLFN